MSCVEQCLACLNSTVTDLSTGTTSPSNTVLAIIGTAGPLLVVVWQVIVKIPRVQRLLGVQNQQKLNTLETIKQNTEIVAKSHAK
jgi:hypothetical protein